MGSIACSEATPLLNSQILKSSYENPTELVSVRATEVVDPLPL